MDHAVDEGTVAVRFFAGLREEFGTRRITVPLKDARHVDGVLRLLCDTAAREQAVFAEPGVPRKEIVILVDGRNIRFLEGLRTPLHGGEEVAVFPPVYGG